MINPYSHDMHGTAIARSRGQSVRQRWQRLVQTGLWKMDIAPSAWIAPTALIDRTWPKGVHIGREAVIDYQAVVLTHDQTRGLYLDTWIGDGAVIGARAIVLPGLTVGAGARVEPGAVVTRDVAPGVRVAGNPARPFEDQAT